MDWANERYVRLYTRDTVTWKLWRWQSRALFPLIMRAVDRAGVLDLGGAGERGLAAVIDCPLEFVQEGLEDLVGSGTVEISEARLVIPNFLEAQEAVQSDAQRQRDSRERRRARALNEVSEQTAESRAVTECHTESQGVTGCHSSLPSQTSLPGTEGAAGDPSPEPGKKKSKPRIHPDRQALIDAVHRRYEERYGEKPHWGGKEREIANRLVKRHGLSKCLERLDRLYTSPPDWADGPFDIASLESLWNKLPQGRAPPSNSRGHARAEEQFVGGDRV